MNFFKKSNKNKKLYKFVYKTSFSSYNSGHTLLIPGVNPVDAVETFYTRVGKDVKDILEFTEINYGNDVKKETNDGV